MIIVALLDDLRARLADIVNADQREAQISTMMRLQSCSPLTNINRGVERLFVLYLYDEFELDPDENIQD